MNLKVGTLVKIYKGKKANIVPTKISNEVQRFIQIDDLRNDNNLKFTDSEGIHVQPDDVIIAWDGANAGTIGYGLSGIIGSTLAKLELQTDNVLPQYFGRFLKSKSKYLRDKCTGATIPHISGQVLANLQVPLLSIEEQKRIVKILDQADSLCQKRTHAINLLDKYLYSTFQEMFGRKAKNYDKWETVKLADLAEGKKGSMRTGPFGSDLKHSEFVDSGIAVIGIDNAVQNKFAWDERRFITKEKYEKLKRYTLYPNDVIITIMGTVGRSAVIPEDIPLSINTKHLAAITLNKQKANPYFISYSIHSNPDIIDQINKKGKGAIMTGLNLGIIKDLNIKLPPIESQNNFAEIQHTTEMVKGKMNKQLYELDNQFQALMQQSFATS